MNLLQTHLAFLANELQIGCGRKRLRDPLQICRKHPCREALSSLLFRHADRVNANCGPVRHMKRHRLRLKLLLIRSCSACVTNDHVGRGLHCHHEQIGCIGQPVFKLLLGGGLVSWVTQSFQLRNAIQVFNCSRPASKAAIRLGAPVTHSLAREELNFYRRAKSN